MIGSALTLKVLAVTIAGGALISSVTVPTVMALKAPPPSNHSPSEIVINGFPNSHESRYRDECQVLIKNEVKGTNNAKYLFVCSESGGDSLALYFYDDMTGGEPEEATITKEKEEGNKVESKVALAKSGMSAYLTTPPAPWIDLLAKGFEGCGFTNNGEKNKPWAITCPKGGSSGIKIPLTPVTINPA